MYTEIKNIICYNLHFETSEQEIMRYMRANYHGYFKVESIRTQYIVTVPHSRLLLL